MTRYSKFRKVCPSTESTASPMYLATLWTGVTTVTSGALTAAALIRF